MTKDPFIRLYAAIAAEEIERIRHYRKPAQRFTASEAGNCPWRLWFKLRGYRPAPNTPEAVLRMLQGEIDHNLIRNLFRKYNIDIKGVTFDATTDYMGAPVFETMTARKSFEIPMPDGLTDTITLSARADGAVETDEGWAIFEFKGMGQWAYDHLNDEALMGDEYLLKRLEAKHRYYIWQMQISMLLFDYQLAYLGPKHRSDAQYGLERKDGTRFGVVIKRNDAKILEIQQSLAMIQRHVRNGTPPPKSCRELKGSGSCNNCEFYHLCHGADERKKKGLEPVVLYPGPQIEEHPDQPISGEAKE